MSSAPYVCAPQTVLRCKPRGIPPHPQYYREAVTYGALLAPPVRDNAQVRQMLRIAAVVRGVVLEQDAMSAQQTQSVSFLARRVADRIERKELNHDNQKVTMGGTKISRLR